MPKRYFKFTVLLILPVLMGACKAHHFVVDDAGILDSKARAGLENLLSSYHKKTTCSIYLYSVKKLPEGEDAGSFTKNIAKELGLEKTRLDNDAIIFIALQDRQIIFQPGYGCSLSSMPAYPNWLFVTYSNTSGNRFTNRELLKW